MTWGACKALGEPILREIFGGDLLVILIGVIPIGIFPFNV
jgi:hypothetical protein